MSIQFMSNTHEFKKYEGFEKGPLLHLGKLIWKKSKKVKPLTIANSAQTPAAITANSVCGCVGYVRENVSENIWTCEIVNIQCDTNFPDWRKSSQKIITECVRVLVEGVNFIINKFTGEWNVRKDLKKENEYDCGSRVGKEKLKGKTWIKRKRRRNQVKGKWNMESEEKKQNGTRKRRIE